MSNDLWLLSMIYETKMLKNCFGFSNMHLNELFDCQMQVICLECVKNLVEKHYTGLVSGCFSNYK